MHVTDYTLSFVGPFGMAGPHSKILFAEPEARLPGIYLWAIPYIHGGFLVNYVGETSTSFGQRMKNHLIHKVGGNYRISDPEQMIRGVDAVLWDGLWRKGTRDKMHEYIEKLVDLAPKIQKSIELIHVFVAPLDVETRTRQRIEAALAEHIKSQAGVASSLMAKDVRYYIRRKGEAPLPIQLRCTNSIHGMPEILNA